MGVQKVSKGMREVSKKLDKLEETLEDSRISMNANTKELKKIHSAREAAELKIFDMHQERLNNYKPRQLVRTSPVGLRIHEIDLINLHQNEVSRVNHNHNTTQELNEGEIALKEAELDHAENEITNLKRKLDII